VLVVFQHLILFAVFSIICPTVMDPMSCNNVGLVDALCSICMTVAHSCDLSLVVVAVGRLR